MSNFAAGLGVRNIKQKNKKLGLKGAWPSSRDLLLNFRTPLLSLVKMNLQKSNVVGRLSVTDTIQKVKKWAKDGRGLGHVTYF